MMNAKIKSIIKSLLPPLALRAYYRCRWGLGPRQDTSIIMKNKVLKGLYKGERCFVIGNGSSLNKMDLTKLKNEYVFVVNDFFNHKDFQVIKPAFYSYIEPLENSLRHPPEHPYHPYNYLTRLDRAFANMDTKMFFKTDMKGLIEQNGFLKGKEVYYLANGFNNILSAEEAVRLEDRIDRLYSFADGVIFSAICCAAFMGFGEIYFIGCDCDTFSRRGRTHFYSDECMWGEKGNEWLMYHNSLLLKRWRILTKHFNCKGVKIFNAGIGGDNDVCPRVDYNQIVFK